MNSLKTCWYQSRTFMLGFTVVLYTMPKAYHHRHHRHRRHCTQSACRPVRHKVGTPRNAIQLIYSKRCVHRVRQVHINREIPFKRARARTLHALLLLLHPFSDRIIIARPTGACHKSTGTRAFAKGSKCVLFLLLLCSVLFGMCLVDRRRHCRLG